MSIHGSCTMWLLLAVSPWLTPSQGMAAEPQTILVADGQARCEIWVAERVVAADKDLGGQPSSVQLAEANRQRLRASVEDLALYFEKMSGAQVPIRTGKPADTEGAIPILIGELGVEKFGPPDKQFADQQALRIVVAEDAVGLFGQSDLATSYAIYTLLDRLGCRWYMPGEWGEVIPELKTIALARHDEDLAPLTIYRDIWHSDPVYSRRNRAGGLPIAAGHALEGYLSKEQLQQHPDWNAEIGGERRLHPCDVGHRYLWLSATDGSAKLYINGRHVPYVKEVRDADGQVTTTTTDAFTGYAAPASFDITAAVTPGRNQVTLQCVRLSQNELGTGGLLGPVVLYHEK